MRKEERKQIVIPILLDKESTSIDELDEHLMLIKAARTHLETEWTESVRTFDSRDGHNVHGYPSSVAYLKDRCRMSGSRAQTSMAMARAARHFKSTFLSWKHNQISSDEAVLLFRTTERMPDKYPEAENTLLEIVSDGYDDTRRVLDYWCQSADKPGVVVEEHAQLLRGLVKFFV